jgi:hypothetical protein
MLKMPEILCKRHWKWPDFQRRIQPFLGFNRVGVEDMTFDQPICWSAGPFLTRVHVSNVKMLPKAVSPSLDF